MQRTFILGIDQGTTATTVLIVDMSHLEDMKVIGRSTKTFPQHFPKADWVEHDLEDIWTSVVQACKEACMKAENECPQFRKEFIAGIGITNQRETLCLYDRKHSKPSMRAIVWQCKRSSKICNLLREEGLEDSIREKTGLFVDPYFSGTKIRWILENHPEFAKDMHKGKLLLGTIDSFLISRLGGGKDHVTEASNASRTLLYNLKTGSWDPDLLEVMGLKSANALAEIKDSYGFFTKTKGLDFLPDGIPITGVLGDQQAALAGQHCFGIGEAKCTYGTGAFLLLNIGDKALLSEQKLLTTVAWQIAGERTYALEGSSFIAGAALQFLRDNFDFVKGAWESEALAREASAAPNVYFVPALSGLGAPWWEPNAKGAFLGLTRATSKEQLIRAALEGIAFQVSDLMDSMTLASDSPLKVLRVDGGAAANSLLLEIQSQILGMRVERPHNLETTSLGAVTFAALGSSLISSLKDLGTTSELRSSFEPVRSQAALKLIKEQKEGWKRAINAVRIFSGSKL